MRLMYGSAVAVAIALLASPVIGAQETTRSVAGGGISVPGWPARPMVQAKSTRPSSRRKARISTS